MKDDAVKMDSKRLAGVAVLGALVVVFDYALKFSGLKIPFPWLPFLKFDFTGVPIMICYSLYGLLSGTFTSSVAFLAILSRSGDYIGASMKAIAEFATISGASFGSFFSRFSEGLNRALQIVFGVSFRVAVMIIVNLLVLPNAYGIPFDQALILSPLIGFFNVLQGLLSLIVGFLVSELLKRRVPSLVTRA
jgi:riboflavin transporter FmnP